MGCVPSRESNDHAEASTVVSAGPITLHACFMVCLKLDLYQPKYANIPMTYSVTPCKQGQAFMGGYGVGTVFTGTNAMGSQEVCTVVELEPLARVVIDTRGIQLAYTTTALPNGDCELGVAFDGQEMGRFQKHLEMQLNTMKAFIEANVAAICSDAPPLGSVVSPVEGQCDAPPLGSVVSPVEGQCVAPPSTMTVDAVCDR